MRPPAVALLALLAACTGDAPPASAGGGQRGSPNESASASPRFVLEDRARAIVRVDRDGRGRVKRTPVLRVSDVPTEWEPAPGSRFGIGADSFDFASPSADGRLVAWQGGGVHSLLGVVTGEGGRPRVLDFFFDSQAAAVEWAEGGPYLVARYTGPSGYAQALVYDAERGVRLRAPWDEGCALRDACEVAAVRWTGSTTLAVTTKTPPAGASRSFTAELTQLPQWE